MPFRTQTTIRFADIDPAGVVYYPRFLHYCHTAMEDFFAQALELPYAELIAKHRIGFPAVHLEVDFRSPLRYGDVVDIAVAIAKLGKSSADWRYDLFRNGGESPCAEIRVVTACLDFDAFAAREIPDWLRAKLAGSI